ncbi:pilus assembly protein PilM [Vibrio sp. S4M6]|uniref:pilus assembly protein PilM n=1 Tax=Vibrio sinus TaxID=2946865 RepID=UPI00202AAB2C|nr:pilus assembly protein PilM [Vibrio sinus]MCL9780430.1 pilus assembly protein PilM [Vibrio sinus]
MGNSMITGLDFSPKSVKAVVLKQVGQGVKLICHKEIPIEFYVFSDNFSQDYQKTVKKLKELRKSLPFNSSKVSVAIDDTQVICKQIQIDSALRGSERFNAILRLMSEGLSCAIDELNIDFVATRTTADHLTCYLVYAAQKSFIEQYTMLLMESGFYPMLVDSQSRALMRLWLLASRYYKRTNWLLADISSHRISICMSAPDDELLSFSATIDHQGLSSISDYLTQAIVQFRNDVGLDDPVGCWLTCDRPIKQAEIELVVQKNKLQCQLICPFSLIAHGFDANRPLGHQHHSSFAIALGASLNGLHWLGGDRFAQDKPLALA